MQVCFFDTSNPGFYWLYIPLQRPAATWNSLLQKLCSFWSLLSGKEAELGLHLAWFPVFKKDEWPAWSYWECPHLWHSVWSQHHGHKQVEREWVLNVKAVLNEALWTGPTTGPEENVILCFSTIISWMSPVCFYWLGKYWMFLIKYYIFNILALKYYLKFNLH